MAIFPGGPGLASIKIVLILDSIGTKDDGGGGDNWSYNTCKKLPSNRHHQQTNIQFLQAGCPSCRVSPNQQCSTDGMEGKTLICPTDSSNSTVTDYTATYFTVFC